MSALRSVTGDPVGLFSMRLAKPPRKYGKGWRGNCPACDDRKGALSFTAGDDGRLLLHCFKGCGAAEILGAVGLTLADLYPERLGPQTPEERRASMRAMQEVGWRAALSVLSAEATVVLIAARQTRDGWPLEADDAGRLGKAVERIESAKAVLVER